jgi:uncharacterized protein
MRPIIVGVDIGTTTGVAIYDLDRNLVYAGSKRSISIDSLIREIGFYGKPIIIATDKKKVPQPVTKIAASFNCKVFSPDHDLTVDEKERIVSIPIKDVHEKDALSAATFAFKSFAPQFNNIDRNLESMDMGDLKDRVKELIVNKEAKNIAEAVEKLRPKEEPKVVEKVVKEVYLNWRERTKELECKVKDDQRRYEILRNYAEKIETKMKDLERQKQMYLEEEMRKNDEARKKVIREKEIRNRDILLKQLQFELSKQKHLNRSFEDSLDFQDEKKDIEKENLLPVIIIPEFTRESISLTDKRFGMRNKIVWVKNFKLSNSSLSLISDIMPKMLIGKLDDNSKDILMSKGIIVVDSISPQERKHYAAVPLSKIENEVKKLEKKSFMGWLDDYRKRTI